MKYKIARGKIMGLYEGIKDVAKVIQQAGNVELYKKLLDLSAQALETQAEILKLKEENAELKKKGDISEKIVRHQSPYITKAGDEPIILYCSHCWDSEELLIQLNCNDTDGTYVCPHCKTNGIYDKELNKSYRSALSESIMSMNRQLSRKSPWNI